MVIRASTAPWTHDRNARPMARRSWGMGVYTVVWCQGGRRGAIGDMGSSLQKCRRLDGRPDPHISRAGCYVRMGNPTFFFEYPRLLTDMNPEGKGGCSDTRTLREISGHLRLFSR